LTAIPKLEGDNTDMEEDNIHVNMEEDNIIDVEEVLTYRKRPYRCVKRQETTDTEHSCDSSLASAIVRRANINERVAGLLAAIPKLEGDNIDLEENNVEMEEDNSLTNRKRKYQSVKSHETTDIDQRSKHSVSITASVIEQMKCPNGSYITQFLNKYVYMYSCPAILSSCTFLHGHLQMWVMGI
jgi:hypothetical protein